MPLGALKHTKESLFHRGVKENTVHFELFIILAFLKKKVLITVALNGNFILLKIVDKEWLLTNIEALK